MLGVQTIAHIKHPDVSVSLAQSSAATSPELYMTDGSDEYL